MLPFASHRCLLLCALLATLLGTEANAAPWVTEQPAPQAFPLFDGHAAATLNVSSTDATVVRIAVETLAQDIEAVTGQRPALSSRSAGPSVIVGTLGQHAVIDRLVAQGRIDVEALRGAWESFLIVGLERPEAGSGPALLIIGSDRRGTAYGVYELSEAIGVSPWHWWADVRPAPREALYVDTHRRRFGPPSVRYRGLFINDEDWGLLPWAARTHEPDYGNIGPKTYARVFELLLRLKANTLWPAMHPTTQAFNADPDNARLADDYAIVMGSSHAEPMLRNNVGEWTAPPQDYDYVHHREGVRDYWEARIRANGHYENLYTLGMRGVHDSGIQGAETDAERIDVLQRVFADQRELLRDHVSPDLSQVPQLFCAYKEVLSLYRQGLAVPDDATLVWPDDNFGYLRGLPGDAERRRTGGSGVYYHISYLGHPLAYLWLGTTPPALIWEEMHKAWEHGADRIWIVNAGDIKPAEIGVEFFLRMAWNAEAWNADAQTVFLHQWAAREFGPDQAGAIAGLMADTYRLNFERRPEHLQWWLPGERPRGSPLSLGDARERLDRFADLLQQSAAVLERLPSRLHDAYFELVDYPLRASALANARYFEAEAYGRLAHEQPALAGRHAAAAREADAGLKALTHRYNEDLAGGKWRHFMSEEPADNQWRSMRIAPLPLPAASLADAAEAPPVPATDEPRPIHLKASAASDLQAPAGLRWQAIDGLDALTTLPSTQTVDPARPDRAATADFRIRIEHDGHYLVELDLLPTQAPTPGRRQRLAITVDDAEPLALELALEVGADAWQQAVLDNRQRLDTGHPWPLDAGTHRVRVHAFDGGLVLRGVRLRRAEAR